MPPALIAGAVAIAGAGASIYSAGKNSKAIKKATAVQQQSTDQQIAFQQQARAENTAALSPWMQRGNVAGETINAALGVGGALTSPAGAPPGTLTVPYNGGYPDAGQYPGYNGMAPEISASWMPAQPAAPQPQQNPAQAAASAYEIFKNSVGYQTRLQEGQRGQGAMYSALGTYQSGARDKALARFNQNFASNEFGNWLGYLGNQQSLGFASASALAGVAQGSADRMGAISQNSADTASQAAIARAANSGALMTSLAGTAGNAVGALSSYRQPTYRYG